MDRSLCVFRKRSFHLIHVSPHLAWPTVVSTFLHVLPCTCTRFVYRFFAVVPVDGSIHCHSARRFMLWPTGRAEPSHQEEPPALTARCCCVHRRPGRFSNTGHRNVGPGTPPGLLTALAPLCCGHTAVLGGREILGFCWLEREVVFFAVGTSLLFLMDPSSGQERESPLPFLLKSETHPLA